MTDRRIHEESAAKAKLPFLLVGLLALIAAFSVGIVGVFFVILAFLIGYLPIEKILFFVNGVEDRRRRGRATLHRVPEPEIERLLGIVRDGRKIEAIKELRAIHEDGLRDAMDAIELLEDFGLNWRDSQDKPPR